MGGEPVYLNIYDLSDQNNWTYWCGVGIFHSGLEVYGVEYAYGGEDWHFGSSKACCRCATSSKPAPIGRTSELRQVLQVTSMMCQVCLLQTPKMRQGLVSLQLWCLASDAHSLHDTASCSNQTLSAMQSSFGKACWWEQLKHHLSRCSRQSSKWGKYTRATCIIYCSATAITFPMICA